MKKNPGDIKIFISSVLPDVGIDLLRKEDFNVICWSNDMPIPQDELIANARSEAEHKRFSSESAETVASASFL